jgi:hypothetical protein
LPQGLAAGITLESQTIQGIQYIPGQSAVSEEKGSASIGQGCIRSIPQSNEDAGTIPRFLIFRPTGAFTSRLSAGWSSFPSLDYDYDSDWTPVCGTFTRWNGS